MMWSSSISRGLLDRIGKPAVFLAAGLLSFAALPGELAAQSRDIIIDDGTVSKLVLAPSTTLTVNTNQPFADIVIGNTGIADVFPLTDTSLYIQAKASGLTNVTLYSTEKQLLEVIDVRVQLDFSDLENVIRRTVPSARVDVLNVNNRIRLSGIVKDNVDRQRILQIASQYSADPVVDALRVASAQQVELDVRILEVERNSGRSLGVDLTGTRENGETAFVTNGAIFAAQSGTPFGSAIGELLEISGFQIDMVINALEQKGLARRLANPKLVTTSGIEANFVVGGEVPISVAQVNENGTAVQSTDYREYGVRLNFVPVVLDDQLISLQIMPEVSDIDPSVSVNGQPAFISRKAETTVSLRNGQSFAIAGLLQANNARSVDQVPWLGQIPVLGTLFSSRSFEKRESDLVILVTPRLVAPVGPDTPLRSPLDTTRSSNDIELFLLGMLEVDRDLLRRFREGSGVVGPYGHMIDLEFDDAVIAKK
ncbi:type II and III secretion system protein family protein [Yangia mangrovi]|uniref:Type II and III secretion system protein family protein n=1 Tax=Alloyangia mangrovi TaxID=1779329 RepID=A0ABT2KPA0_9RHOB|nr:type II and III secretion system protein family protein [Alloyangia mangrovi]MCA0941688.1 type II and III secretion system protein family protein [Alloyangia pacifica]MCA0946934.1 type II and III secretion system protein family protein [Alloyangia pacifica]MCT4371920.1 type II and III secretion system protein family protein [Alloyangia mangrovi]